jgi:membrane protease YdiL (CAAX protease family)
VALAAGFLVFYRGAYRDDLGWDPSRWREDTRLAGGTLLAALVPVFAVQAIFVYVLDLPSSHPIVDLMKKEPAPAVMALVTLMAVVVAPLSEEFAFRVLLQGWLERQQARMRARRTGLFDDRPGFAPLVIASVAFALAHVGHGSDPVALFLFSLFLGYVYRQTHRLLPSLLVHMGLNALTMAQLWLMVYTGEQ